MIQELYMNGDIIRSTGIPALAIMSLLQLHAMVTIQAFLQHSYR